jgi:hypothetical protein
MRLICITYIAGEILIQSVGAMSDSVGAGKVRTLALSELRQALCVKADARIHLCLQTDILCGRVELRLQCFKPAKNWA